MNNNQSWDSKDLLKKALKTAQKHDIAGLERIIQSMPTPNDIGEVVRNITPEQWKKTIADEKRVRKIRKAAIFVLLILAAVLFFGGGGYAVYRFVILPSKEAKALAALETATAQALMLTSEMPTVGTQVPAQTETQMPTPTTAYPTSTFLIYDTNTMSDLTQIYPSLPVTPEMAWIIPADKVVAEPPITDQTFWQPGTRFDPKDEKKDPYFYTLDTSGGTLSWELDEPIYSGIYGIYAIDTLNNSGRSMTVNVVSVDESGTEQTISPSQGADVINFGKIYGGQQNEDEWLFLGAYDVTTPSKLKVTAAFAKGNGEYDSFAFGRLLIIRFTGNENNILSLFPTGNKIIEILDNNRVSFSSEEVSLSNLDVSPVSSDLAWEGQYQIVTPSLSVVILTNLDITWQGIGTLNPGKYKLFVLAPGQKDPIKISYTFLKNGKSPMQSPCSGQMDIGPLENQVNWIGSTDTCILDAVTAVSIRITLAKEDIEKFHISAVALAEVNE